MITKTLQFWGFKEHPFGEGMLEGDSLQLFIDRDDELNDLEDALHNRVTGIYGTLGVGKSTFLNKFATNPSVRGLPIALVRLPSESGDSLYREILAEVLTLVLKGRLKVKGGPRIDWKKELVRLDGTVAYSRTSEFGAQAVFKGTISEKQSKETVQHTESTASRLLRTIIQHASKSFVVILDDFHNLEMGHAGKGRGYFPVLGRLLTTIFQHFNHRNVSFVVTLDQEIDKHIKRSRSRNGGAFAFSIGDFVRIDPLDLSYVFDLIKVRLSIQGWKKEVAHFISEDAFFTLALCGEGHPRRVLRLLRYAMQSVAKSRSKNREKKIQQNHIEIAARKAGESFDKTDFTIVRYLASHGPTSASDEAFENAVGIKRTSLRPRLKSLQKKIRLRANRVKVDRTTQVLYSLPSFEELKVHERL